MQKLARLTMLLNPASYRSVRTAALILIIASPLTANTINFGLASAVQGEPNRDVGRDAGTALAGNASGVAGITATPVVNAVGWWGSGPAALGGGGGGGGSSGGGGASVAFLPAMAPTVANLTPATIPVSRGLDTIIAPGSRWEASAQVRAQTAAAVAAAAVPVPDGGLTIALLGATLLSLVWLRRKYPKARKA